MKWFKFYGQDYLTDPKIKSLSVEMRQCWIVLMCIASSEEKNGKIKYVDENEIKRLCGIEEDGQTWHETTGFLELFEDLDMITIDNVINNLHDITLTNFNKRQGDAMTPYERVKKYREKKKKENRNDNASPLSKRNEKLQNVIKSDPNDNSDNENDNGRLDKNRKEENILIPKNNKKGSIANLTGEDFQEIATDYQTTISHVLSCLDDLRNYCDRTGRKYKDYKAALRNFVKKDALSRKEKYAKDAGKNHIEYVGDPL